MKLILAVSGGVDSVVMLHAIHAQNLRFGLGLELVVAHFDHGIRNDSAADARFVKSLSQMYEVDYVQGQAALGADASEATARKARWDFLKKARKDHDALAVMTAHHAGDVLETIIINIIRGTGRRGFNVLKNTDAIIRPLIKNTKQEIYEYALKHQLEYIEDESNNAMSYLRNRVRHIYVPKLKSHTPQLHDYIQKVIKDDQEIIFLIEGLYETISQETKNYISLSRHELAALPDQIAHELLRYTLDQTLSVHDKQKISQELIKRLMHFAQREDSNKLMDVSKMLRAEITREELVIHRLTSDS